MTTFAVTAPLPGRAPEMLAEAGEVRGGADPGRLEREQLLALVEGADIAVTMLFDRVDDEFLDAAGPNLRAVCNVAVGFDNVDLAACARRSVVVTNTPGVLDDATADLTFALILAARRRLGEGERLVREGGPWEWGMGFMVGHDLRGGRLGIVGLGGIGARVAARGRAFGMEIAYFGRHESPHAGELGATRLELTSCSRRATWSASTRR
jgi:glyoxylate reductase